MEGGAAQDPNARGLRRKSLCVEGVLICCCRSIDKHRRAESRRASTKTKLRSNEFDEMETPKK